MSPKKITVTAAVVASLALTATACNSGSSSSSSTKIGLSISTLNNPFFVQLKAGASAEAKKEGVDLTVTDAQNDASQQANLVQNFISQNVKAIILNPVDSDAAAPSVKSANKAKIPVVAVDRTVNKGTVATTVASDNIAGGKLAAKTIADQLGGKGSILVLQGTAGTSAANEREQGFTEGLQAYPGIKVVASQPTNLLQAHSGITGIFAANDEMALGAIKALGSKAGKSVKVVGFDGTPDGLAAVKAGTLSASVAQQPSELGKLAVQNAVKASKGEKVTNPVKVPVKVVTSANVASFSS
jgi:ribose transport system substrate-binding protein